jgi:hypothetical protein
MHDLTEDFEGGGWVFVKICRGKPWPGKIHMNADSVGQGQVIDTRSPAVYILDICV